MVDRGVFLNEGKQSPRNRCDFYSLGNFVAAEVSVGIKNRLYLASSRPGVTTGYSITFMVSGIILCVIIDRSGHQSVDRLLERS